MVVFADLNVIFLFNIKRRNLFRSVVYAAFNDEIRSFFKFVAAKTLRGKFDHWNIVTCRIEAHKTKAPKHPTQFQFGKIKVGRPFESDELSIRQALKSDVKEVSVTFNVENEDASGWN